MKIVKKISLGLYLFLFCIPASFGKNSNNIPLLPLEKIPDSSELRTTIAASWLLDTPESVLSQEPQVYTDRAGKQFIVQSYQLQDTNILEVKITPKDTIFLETADNTTPQGVWILQRDITTGAPISIKIFPRETSELFIHLKPGNANVLNSSNIDFCLFSAYVRKDVNIAIQFSELYYTSIIDLKKMTDDILPWCIFSPPATYSTVESVSTVIKKNIHELVFLEDGALDAFGKPVYISNLKPQSKQDILYAAKNHSTPAHKKIIGGVNCSGFVKWIVDGVIKPIAGQGTYIKSLERSTDIPISNFNKPYVQKRELFFGLDWIRNLAAARMSLTMKKTVYPQNSGLDVKVEPFSFTLPVAGGKISEQKFGGYFANIGYQTEYLEALLYYMAITEPGNFYLGALNREIGSPALRQYYHVVAFFPYFDVLGCFHIDVYESATQTDIKEFIRKNKKAFTTLVRIKAPEPGFYIP